MRFLLYAVPVVFTLWAIVEAAGTLTPRLMPRWSWVLLTIFVPVFGAAFWFISGRPRKNQFPPSGPDDDQDFLRSL